MPKDSFRLAIFFSGRGSNMVAIAEQAQRGILQPYCQVALAFTNNPQAGGIALAHQMQLPVVCLPLSKGQSREEYDRQVVQILYEHQIDMVVLAGYMRILSPWFIAAYCGKIINIHPADTRQHQGKEGYAWAWEQRLSQTLITVHLVDEGLDTGLILGQHPVDLVGATTLAEVEQRGLAVENRFYSEVLREYLSHRQSTATK